MRRRRKLLPPRFASLARRRRPFRRRGGEPPTLCSRRIWWVCCDVLQVRRRRRSRRGCLTASSSTRGTAPSASSLGSGPPATAARVRTHLSLSPVRWFRRSCFPTVVRFVCVSLPIVRVVRVSLGLSSLPPLLWHALSPYMVIWYVPLQLVELK